MDSASWARSFHDNVAPPHPPSRSDSAILAAPQKCVVDARAALPGVEQGLLANLHNYVQINAAQLGRMAERCKRIVPVAVDRAIVELINNTVDKSVTTACMTTQELVLKVGCPGDFPLESTAYISPFSALVLTAVQSISHAMVCDDHLLLKPTDNLLIDVLLNDVLQESIVQL